MNLSSQFRLAVVVVILMAGSAFAQDAVKGRPSGPGPTREERLAIPVPPPRPKSSTSCYVLAVGINQFKYYPSLTLRGAVKDAEAVAHLFREQGRHVSVKTLLNGAATGVAIIQALDDLSKKANPGSRVIVFMSSHGGRYGTRFQFIPYDAADTPFSGESKQLSVSDFNDRLFRVLTYLAQSREVILIIDACHAGQVLVNLSGSLAQKAEGGLVVLASSVAVQSSLDGPNHGRFTGALLEALEGHADQLGDGNGAVTLKEVRRYLSTRMKDLEADSFRLPGMPFREQDFVCDASYSISETLTLSRPQRKASPIEPVKWVAAPEAKFKNAAAVAPGTWQIVWTTKDQNGRVPVGKDGKQKQEKLVLDFLPDGRFTSEFSSEGNAIKWAGKWMKDSNRPSDIDMVLEGGIDSFRIESLDANSFRGSFYQHDKYYKTITLDNDFANRKVSWSVGINFFFDPKYPPMAYTFERVKAQK